MLAPDAEQIVRLIEHLAVLTALGALTLIGIIRLILQELHSVAVLYKQLRSIVSGEEDRRAAGND